MAVIRNTTNDTLSLFRADAPPIDPGDEITVRDENFVDRAWPKSTWELIEAPQLDGYADYSTDEAWLYAEPTVADVVEEQGKPLSDMTVPELKQVIADAGIETDATKKSDLIDAITAHTQED